MHRDRYDLPLTTASEAAAAAYRDGVDLILSAWTGSAEALDRAIKEDPDFALAYIARARLHQICGQATEARAKAAQARKLAVKATQRERQHVEINASAIEGQQAVALAAAEQHLDEFPRDVLVFSLLLGAYGLYAFSGRIDHDAARVAICERHARHYGADWWFLTYLGWSHTEAGNVGHGRALTEQALTRRRENGHCAHALAHAMFEQGDTAAAGAFLDDWLPDYDRAGILNGHLSWHGALLALEAGDAAGALRLYQERIGPAVSLAPPFATFADAASLLWRLALIGKQDLAPHWRDIAVYGARVFPRPGVHFIDMHWALAAAATNDASFDARIAEIEELHAGGKLAPGQHAIDLCRGVRAFAEGDHDGAIRLLEPSMSEVTRIGGSHAQRELYEDTLIVACLRGGQAAKARRLIDDRLHRRPSARDTAWLQQAQQGLQ